MKEVDNTELTKKHNEWFSKNAQRNETRRNGILSRTNNINGGTNLPII